MSSFDFRSVVERYIAAWNDSDPVRRADAAAELWAADALLVNTRQEYRGIDDVRTAIERSFDRFVSAGYRYRAREGTSSHHDGICVLWEMLDPEGGVASYGANFLLLDANRRITLDYQFTER